MSAFRAATANGGSSSSGLGNRRRGNSAEKESVRGRRAGRKGTRLDNLRKPKRLRRVLRSRIKDKLDLYKSLCSVGGRVALRRPAEQQSRPPTVSMGARSGIKEERNRDEAKPFSQTDDRPPVESERLTPESFEIFESIDSFSSGGSLGRFSPISIPTNNNADSPARHGGGEESYICPQEEFPVLQFSPAEEDEFSERSIYTVPEEFEMTTAEFLKRFCSLQIQPTTSAAVNIDVIDILVERLKALASYFGNDGEDDYMCWRFQSALASVVQFYKEETSRRAKGSGRMDGRGEGAHRSGEPRAAPSNLRTVKALCWNHRCLQFCQKYLKIGDNGFEYSPWGKKDSQGSDGEFEASINMMESCLSEREFEGDV